MVELGFTYGDAVTGKTSFSKSGQTAIEPNGTTNCTISPDKVVYR